MPHFSAPATWDELGSWQQLPQFPDVSCCNHVCLVEAASVTASAGIGRESCLHLQDHRFDRGGAAQALPATRAQLGLLPGNKINSQAQPGGIGACSEALAGGFEHAWAVRIQLGEALRACGGHLLRLKVHLEPRP